jgi:hypothetical protein
MTEKHDQVSMRWPAGLKDDLAAIAAQNYRSLRAETVKAITEYVETHRRAIDTLTTPAAAEALGAGEGGEDGNG